MRTSAWVVTNERGGFDVCVLRCMYWIECECLHAAWKGGRVTHEWYDSIQRMNGIVINSTVGTQRSGIGQICFRS